MGHRAIHEKIIFLLPINDRTATCGIYGSCPDSVIRRLHSMGIATIPIPPEGAGSPPEHCHSERGRSFEASDLLLLATVPSGRSEKECFMRHILSLNAMECPIAIMGDMACPGAPARLLRLVRLLRGVSFARRAISFAKFLGADNINLITVVPSFSAPSAALAVNDSGRLLFFRKNFFNFLRGDGVISEALIALLTWTKLIYFLIGDQLIIAKRNEHFRPVHNAQ